MVVGSLLEPGSERKLFIVVVLITYLLARARRANDVLPP
jgi:hypothetical protein